METQNFFQVYKFTLIPQFQTLVNKVQKDQLFQQIINNAQKHYDIKCFKFSSSFTPNIALQVWNELQTKRVTDLQSLRPCNWQQNQRRLFVWFVICFCYYQTITLTKLREEHYNELSQMFFHKEPIFLQYQCQILIKKNSRCTWSVQQDKILIELIQDHASGKWNQIAKEMFFRSGRKLFRTPKQCRQRWLNHLDKSKVKGDWDLSQDYKILKFVKLNGKKWAKIVPILDNIRTEHMIKNRFKSIISKNGAKTQQSQKQIIERVIEIMQSEQKAEQQSNSTTPNINTHYSFEDEGLFGQDFQKMKKGVSSTSTTSTNSLIFGIQNNKNNQLLKEKQYFDLKNNYAQDFLNFYNTFNTLIANQSNNFYESSAPALSKVQSFKPFNQNQLSIFEFSSQNVKIKDFDEINKIDTQRSFQREIKIIQLNI